MLGGCEARVDCGNEKKRACTRGVVKGDLETNWVGKGVWRRLKEDSKVYTAPPDVEDRVPDMS